MSTPVRLQEAQPPLTLMGHLLRWANKVCGGSWSGALVKSGQVRSSQVRADRDARRTAEEVCDLCRGRLARAEHMLDHQTGARGAAACAREAPPNDRQGCSHDCSHGPWCS